MAKERKRKKKFDPENLFYLKLFRNFIFITLNLRFKTDIFAANSAKENEN